MESDGHHVSALRFDGTVLWRRDLYRDMTRMNWTKVFGETAELDRQFFGEIRDRKIVSISRFQGSLTVGFSSGDFGVVDAVNGNVTEFGRD